MNFESANQWKKTGLLIVLASVVGGLFFVAPKQSASEADVVAARYHLRSRTNNFYARSKPGYSSTAKQRADLAARKHRG